MMSMSLEDSGWGTNHWKLFREEAEKGKCASCGRNDSSRPTIVDFNAPTAKDQTTLAPPEQQF